MHLPRLPAAYLISLLATACAFAQLAPVKQLADADALPVSATASLREFNDGWRFHLGDAPGAEMPDFDDRMWTSVDLPHDWSIESAPDKDTPEGLSVGYFRGGVGWYRKTFVRSAPDVGRRYDLVFDGVQQECDVWINGHHAAFQPHGYIGFVVDLTPHLNAPGIPNAIVVRAVNPERNSRWYSGSGIYRAVRLRVRDEVDVATSGLWIDTAWIAKGKAQLQVRAEIRSEATLPSDAVLSLRLTGPDGSSEEFDLGQVSLGPRAIEVVSQRITLNGPKLWSPSSPALYTAEAVVRRTGRPPSAPVRQRFGIREVSVSAEGGFRINGAPIELKGACLHHDNGLLGAAAFEAAEWRRVAIMKRNGFNAIRTSHNPPSSAFLDACDALGVVVIDEFVDMWEFPKKPNGYNRYFARHWQQDLTAFLRRDYNHPSVVMWSIGNEVQERAKPLGLDIARRMIDGIRGFDRQRPITHAICDFWDNPDLSGKWDATAAAFALLDVGGYNYKWEEYERDHAKHPTRVMAGTESFPREAYENWRAVERLPYVIGDFVWTGMDHLGESGIGNTRYVPEQGGQVENTMPWPTYVNWCGDIDIVGNKKPQSFYRDVVWDRSMVEVAAHPPVPAGMKEAVSLWGWPDELPSWNWKGREGQRFTVRVFSKRPRVRLELNGRTVGEQAIDAASGIVATFAVPYAPGELKAIALEADGSVAGTRTLTTTESPARIVCAPEPDSGSTQRELVFVPIELRDGGARWVDDARVPLTAKITGPARLLAFGTANPADIASCRDESTESFRGRALLVLRKTGHGRVTVTIDSPGVESGRAEFDTN